MSMLKSLPSRTTHLGSQLRRMVFTVTLPLMLVILLVTSLGIGYALQYRTTLDNITTASLFNENFRADVDQKTYWYVINHQDSDGLPLEEVRHAKGIAADLAEKTVERQSSRAITSVYNLCNNLEHQLTQLTELEYYGARRAHLETRIYYLTELIEKYMYTYLYDEAVHLKVLQSRMATSMIVLMLSTMALSALLLFALLRYSGRFSRKLTEPLNALCLRLEDIGQGNLDARKPLHADTQEIEILSEGIEKMVGHLQQLMEENRTKEKQRRKTELALLQAQINPHFLYNTMDTIIWLIESGDSDRAVTMINSLSNFFRFSLSRGKSLITLAEEKRHIESYLEIQVVRYRDIMEYTIDLPEELMCCTLPKLTLQPLVENALYHGIKLQRRLGHIRVSGQRIGQDMLLTVADDGVGMTEEQLRAVKESMADNQSSGAHFGLRAVHQRLAILYGESYGLALQSTPGAGTVVTARIPIQESQESPPPA